MAIFCQTDSNFIKLCSPNANQMPHSLPNRKVYFALRAKSLTVVNRPDLHTKDLILQFITSALSHAHKDSSPKKDYYRGKIHCSGEEKITFSQP